MFSAMYSPVSTATRQLPGHLSSHPEVVGWFDVGPLAVAVSLVEFELPTVTAVVMDFMNVKITD
jgi:hypothetical protein